MATHSSVLAWRIPGTGEPGGLPSMGSHRVGHDWSDLAASALGSGASLFISRGWFFCGWLSKYSPREDHSSRCCQNFTRISSGSGLFFFLFLFFFYAHVSQWAVTLNSQNLHLFWRTCPRAAGTSSIHPHRFPEVSGDLCPCQIVFTQWLTGVGIVLSPLPKSQV